MLAHADMNPEQIKAVAETLLEYMSPRGYGEGDEEWEDTTPILPGQMRKSRSGADWGNFPGAPDKWFRLRDCPYNPMQPDYGGFEIVLSPDGAPLGNTYGVLIMHKIRGFWLAQIVNTGWNKEDEIIWPEVVETP